MVPGAADALKRFELENDIQSIDSIFRYNNEEQQRHLQGRPWTKDPKYFKHVRISALALVKMVMHARSGGSLEVMGLMQGKIDPEDPRGPTLIVMDAFALPVEGTETRVNAQADAYEYMVEFQSLAKDGSRMENVMGWYHSHPGYGCWLSGIDCSTQACGARAAAAARAASRHPTRGRGAGTEERVHTQIRSPAPTHSHPRPRSSTAQKREPPRSCDPHRRADAQSAIPGAVARCRDRPYAHRVDRQGRDRRFPHIPAGALPNHGRRKPTPRPTHRPPSHKPPPPLPPVPASHPDGEPYGRQGYHPPDEAPNEFESVPLAKIEDFGARRGRAADRRATGR